MQDFRRPTHTTSSLGVVNAERGFSMLEVMISMFILATGLFGLIGVQLMAHKSELDSYQRAQALVLLTDIVDRINDVPIKIVNGTPVLIRDIARVELAPDERRGVTELRSSATTSWSAKSRRRSRLRDLDRHRSTLRSPCARRVATTSSPSASSSARP